jgi:hypothetical protein
MFLFQNSNFSMNALTLSFWVRILIWEPCIHVVA